MLTYILALTYRISFSKNLGSGISKEDKSAKNNFLGKSKIYFTSGSLD